MKKARILLILAVWVAVLPYLGFPSSWKNLLFTITGFMLAYMAYSLYKEYKINTKDIKEEAFDNFSENKDFNENKINTTDENNFT
jgi:hypothetical protein